MLTVQNATSLLLIFSAAKYSPTVHILKILKITSNNTSNYDVNNRDESVDNVEDVDNTPAIIQFLCLLYRSFLNIKKRDDTGASSAQLKHVVPLTEVFDLASLSCALLSNMLQTMKC